MKRLIASILISAMIIFGLPLNAPVIRENIGERFAQMFTTPDASAAWVFRNFSGTNKAAVFSTVKFGVKGGLIGNKSAIVEAYNDVFTANTYCGQTFVTTTPGQVSYIHVRYKSGSGNVNAGIFDSGKNKLSDATSVTAGLGRKDFALDSPVQITASTTYWLIVAPAANGSFYMFLGGSGLKKESNSNINPMSSTVTMGTNFSTDGMLIWADNLPTGGE